MIEKFLSWINKYKKSLEPLKEPSALEMIYKYRKADRLWEKWKEIHEWQKKIISKPEDDKIWGNKKFWNAVWVARAEEQAELVEKTRQIIMDWRITCAV